MTTDPLPEHINRPHVRRLQPIPVKDNEGRPMVALRDPAMLVGQTMVVPPPVLQLIHLFQGTHSLEEIAQQTNGQVPADQLANLARGLDQVGLLWGPTFESLENDARTKLEQRGAFEPRATTSLGADREQAGHTMRGYFDAAEDPELDSTPIGIVVPHLDYERGNDNYAAAYFGLRDTPAPDRVVILGTNHFGIGDGVVLTQFGFETVFGTCPCDRAVVDSLVDTLGNNVVVDQLDHLAEHSIELQVPWIQQCWGDVPVVAVLCPDPLAPMIEEDGKRIDRETFIAALRAVLDTAGGTTFVVASADLSHVGPQFGEPRPVDEQRRHDVERHDRDMLAKFLTGDAEAFISAAQWNKNPTRWCSIGNMAAALELLQPRQVELIDYQQAVDENGMALVSTAAITLH
jgi:AmmeMemoRadiSam system protein B